MMVQRAHSLGKSLALMLPLLGGCYTYAETSLETLSPGLQTRVVLDDDGFGRVVNQAAMNGVPMENLDLGGRGIVGRLMSMDPTSMTVELRGAGGSVFPADIPMHAVQGVAVRSFSRPRTLLAVGGGAAIGALILSGTVGGTTGPGQPPEEELSRFPLFSIPMR